MISFVFKVLRKGLPSSILSHMSKPVIKFAFKVVRDCLRPFFTQAQTCGNVRVQRQTQKHGVQFQNLKHFEENGFEPKAAAV